MSDPHHSPLVAIRRRIAQHRATLLVGELSTAETLGRVTLAPVLAAWSNAVVDWMIEAPNLHGLALLRDGALLGDSVGHHAPALKPRLGRLWLGRRHTAIAAIAHACDHENLLNLLVRMRHRPACWGEAAAELALPRPDNDDAILTGDTLSRFFDWIAQPSVAACLHRRVESLRQRILAHVDAQNIPSDSSLLLLDIGYAATIQRCLKRILTLAGRPRPVHGLYLLTSPGARWAMTGDGEVRSVLAHLGEPGDFAEVMLRHRDVVECLLTTPLGELRDYDEHGTALANRVHTSARQRKSVAHIQAAALAVCHDGGSVADARQALTRLLLHPTAAEAALMGAWRHADSTAMDGPRRLDDGPPVGERDRTLWPAAAALRAEKC